nr:hypothetical protein [Alteromonas macleodii]
MNNICDFMTKEELDNALIERDSLRAQLANANEDYKALFSAFESCQDELKKANDRVKELEVRYSELRNKVGISSANIELEMNNKNHRNKILSQAKIEVLQKIKSKAVDLMHKNWIISQSPSVEKLMEQPVWLSTDIIDSEIEQLRKEQDNE